MVLQFYILKSVERGMPNIHFTMVEIDSNKSLHVTGRTERGGGGVRHLYLKYELSFIQKVFVRLLAFVGQYLTPPPHSNCLCYVPDA